LSRSVGNVADGKRTVSIETIVSMAAVHFRREGYERTHMSSLSAELGLTKVGLFRAVQTKEKLLFEVVRDVRNEVGDIVDRLDEGDEPVSALGRFCREWVNYHIDNPNRTAVYYRDIRYLSPEHRLELGDLSVARRRLTALVASGQRKGAFSDDLDARLAAIGLLAVLTWAYRWFDPSGPLSSKDVAEIGATFVLSALSKAS